MKNPGKGNEHLEYSLIEGAYGVKIIYYLLRYGENQFMARIRFFILAAIVTGFLGGCSWNSGSNDEAIRYLNESLQNSQRTINKATQSLLFTLKEKAKDPLTSYKANIWLPKASLVNSYTKELIY